MKHRFIRAIDLGIFICTAMGLASCSSGSSQSATDGSNQLKHATASLNIDRDHFDWVVQDILKNRVIEGDGLQALPNEPNEPILGGLGYDLVRVVDEGALSSIETNLNEGSISFELISNLLNPWQATAHVTTSLEEEAILACEIEAPYEDVAECQVGEPGFRISSAAISKSGDFKVKVFAKSESSSLNTLLTNSVHFNRNSLERVADIAGAQNSDAVEKIKPAIFRSKAFFRAKNAFGAFKLYSFDGDKLSQISDLRADPLLSDEIESVTATSGGIVFSGSAGQGKKKLFLYDGSQIKPISNISSTVLAEYAGALYFVGYNSLSKQKLFRWNGSEVEQISNLSGSQSQDDGILSLQAFSSGLFMKHRSTSSHSGSIFRIVRYDGHKMIEFSAGADTSVDENPTNLVERGNDVFFVAQRSLDAYEIFRIHEDVISQVTQLSAEWLKALTNFENSLYFVHLYNMHRISFEGDKPSKIERVADTTGPLDDFNQDFVSEIIATDKALIFSARNEMQAMKLFSFDGENLLELPSTRGDRSLSDEPTEIVPHYDGVYYWSRNAEGARKLFRLGTNGVSQVSNIFSSGQDDQVLDGACLLSPKFLQSTPFGLLFPIFDPTTCNSKLFTFE